MAKRPAGQLLGRTLPGGWKVMQPRHKTPRSTGGNFSQGYIVENEDGRRGFLKAMDFLSAFGSDDPSAALQAMTELFNFERALLDRCKVGRMKRIVQAIDHGKVFIEEGNVASVVQYLIFELAEEGDVRSHHDDYNQFNIAWSLRCLHHITTGLYQLHKGDIVHQDVKPSNVLVFRDRITKLADLGSAAWKEGPSPRGECAIPGDATYAPPELLYGHAESDWDARRLACDLYLLGSMIVFFITAVPITALIVQHTAEKYQPHTWRGNYRDVLPYVRDGFDRSLWVFEEQVPKDIRPALVADVRQLCDPDPLLRGHPRNHRPGGRPYSLERYVSHFNLMASQAEYVFKKV